MIEVHELWSRVQRALDRHEDPLQDARVRAGLARHPGERAEVERLVALVCELEQLRPKTSRRRPAAALALAVLASAAAALLVLSRGRRDAAPPTVEAPASRSRVLSLRMTSERRDAQGLSIERRDIAERETSSTHQLRPPPAAGPDTRTAATLVAWTETETRP